MALDEEYDDGYLLNEEDEIALVEESPVGEFFSDRLQEELDFDLYEQEKEEADSDDFPESFEEWKILKEQERWGEDEEEDDTELDEPDLLSYEP